MSRRRQSLPLADVSVLRGAARSTRRVAAVLALALCALIAATVVESSRLRSHEQFLPANRSGIVVLDISASISEDTFARIRETLRRLAASESRFGLVLFSDVAYEALPPGTPADEIAPFERFFRFNRSGSSSAASVPAENPWTNVFTGGTRISSGLALARTVLARDGYRNGAVLLVSDLSDDRSDAPRLQDELLRYEKRGIVLRVVALNPTAEDARYFSRLLGDPDLVVRASLPDEQAGDVAGFGADVPRTLLILTLVLLVVLGLNERWTGRLTWGRR